MKELNVFDAIHDIKKQKLASDMPETFTATVMSVSKYRGNYGENLKVELHTEDGFSINVMYRIPKVLTGKGQLDRLLNALKQLDIPLDQMQDKTFEWKRMQLSGTMKGNPRHYPIRVVNTKTTRAKTPTQK